MPWKKGDVIMTAKPYILIILNSQREERCSFCLTRVDSLLKCGACQKLRYCGTSCQKSDWRIHKRECPIIKRVPDLPTESILLFLRLILQHLDGKSAIRLESAESPCLRCFGDLESHAQDIQDDSHRLELFRTASNFVHAYTTGLLDLPSEKVLLDIFGKMVINTFTVADEMLQDVAVAVYNSPSILDHRCQPNAVASFQGRNVIVRAVQEIPDQDFTEVFLCYLDPLAPRAKRRRQLQDQYYFTCDCHRCQDNQLESLMTDLDGSPEGDLVKVKQCLEQVQQMTADKTDPRVIVEMCQKCLQAVSLPDCNVYLVQLRTKAYEAAVDAQMWTEAAALGCPNLGPLQQLNPPYTVSATFAKASLGKLLVFLERIREARAILRQVFEESLVCLGSDHSLVHQVKDLLQQCTMELANRGLT